MSIGSRKPFESVIFSLPDKGKRTNPGSELVAFFRVTDFSAFSIYDTKNDITLEILKKIGTVISKENKFDKSLKIKDTLSRRIVIGNITKLYIVKENENSIFGWIRLSTTMVFDQT